MQADPVVGVMTAAGKDWRYVTFGAVELGGRFLRVTAVIIVAAPPMPIL